MTFQFWKHLSRKACRTGGRPLAQMADADQAVERTPNFLRNNKGNVAIIFALMATMVSGTVGGAVDYGRALQARSKMQNAMDSAILAAARQWQVTGSENADTAIQHGKEVFNALKPQDLPAEPSIVLYPQNSTVVGQVSTEVPAPFLALVGVSSFEVNIESTALLAVGGNSEINVEISMMLDVTGSMGWGNDKLGTMKDAAKDLIDIVVWEDQSEYTSRVALVPFSRYVNVGPAFFQKVTGQNGSNGEKTCVKERPGSKRYSDDAPGPGQFFQYQYSSHRWYGCKPANSPIMPLTNNKDALKARIDSFEASGGTAGHIGTAWAWYMLSPKWNGTVWTGNSQPAAYPPGYNSASKSLREAAYAQAKLKKIAVLMTDGDYNSYYSGASSNVQAKAQCDAMKASGIEIYTVGFELPSNSARAIMEYCATDTEHFYDATDGDKLRLAFRDIALKVATLRLSK